MHQVSRGDTLDTRQRRNALKQFEIFATSWHVLVVISSCASLQTSQQTQPIQMLAGTYLGLVEKLDYLQLLGINAIELLPVQEFNELEYYQVQCLLLCVGHFNCFWRYCCLLQFIVSLTYSGWEDSKTCFCLIPHGALATCIQHDADVHSVLSCEPMASVLHTNSTPCTCQCS